MTNQQPLNYCRAHVRMSNYTMDYAFTTEAGAGLMACRGHIYYIMYPVALSMMK